MDVGVLILLPVNFPCQKKVHARKGLGRLALPRTSHSVGIALAGSRRLRSTLAAAPVILAHDFVAVAKLSCLCTTSRVYRVLFIAFHVPVLPSGCLCLPPRIHYLIVVLCVEMCAYVCTKRS